MRKTVLVPGGSGWGVPLEAAGVDPPFPLAALAPVAVPPFVLFTMAACSTGISLKD
jgi:hypothetical protein